MTREQMFDNIIHKFGFEHDITIMFAAAYEVFDMENLQALYGVCISAKFQNTSKKNLTANTKHGIINITKEKEVWT